MLTAKTLLGIDAGGTFTDFICVRIGETTTVSVHKTLSTPAAPEQAILNGIQALGLQEGLELHDMIAIYYSSFLRISGELTKIEHDVINNNLESSKLPLSIAFSNRKIHK